MSTPVIVLATACSLVSGLLACLVSIFIKLAFNNSSSSSSTELLSLWAVRVCLIGAAIVANSLMWTVYAKSLHLSANTLQATCLNKLSNFVASALFGYLLFDERLHLATWLAGLGLLSLGILILSSSSSSDEQHATTKKRVD